MTAPQPFPRRGQAELYRNRADKLDQLARDCAAEGDVIRADDARKAAAAYRTAADHLEYGDGGR